LTKRTLPRLDNVLPKLYNTVAQGGLGIWIGFEFFKGDFYESSCFAW